MPESLRNSIHAGLCMGELAYSFTPVYQHLTMASFDKIRRRRGRSRRWAYSQSGQRHWYHHCRGASARVCLEMTKCRWLRLDWIGGPLPKCRHLAPKQGTGPHKLHPNTQQTRQGRRFSQPQQLISPSTSLHCQAGSETHTSALRKASRRDWAVGQAIFPVHHEWGAVRRKAA